METALNSDQMASGRAISPENSTNEVLDKKFVSIMLEVEKRFLSDPKTQKHDKIRIEQWVSKNSLNTILIVAETVLSDKKHDLEAQQEYVCDLVA